MLRFVKLEEINRLPWRKQKYLMSRARAQLEAAGLDFLFYFISLKGIENLLKATRLSPGHCM